MCRIQLRIRWCNLFFKIFCAMPWLNSAKIICFMHYPVIQKSKISFLQTKEENRFWWKPHVFAKRFYKILPSMLQRRTTSHSKGEGNAHNYPKADRRNHFTPFCCGGCTKPSGGTLTRANNRKYRSSSFRSFFNGYKSDFIFIKNKLNHIAT